MCWQRTNQPAGHLVRARARALRKEVNDLGDWTDRIELMRDD